MRDAILLHQAISEFTPKPPGSTKPNDLGARSTQGRAELLISRVVRLHWDPRHQQRVKHEYERRYGESATRALTRDVQGNMKTDEGRAWVGFVADLVRSSEPVI